MVLVHIKLHLTSFLIELETDQSEVTFTFPKDGAKSGNYNVKDDIYNFKFNGVLDMMTQ